MTWQRDPAQQLPQRLRRIFHGLRVEGAGPGREAAAIAVGLFVGCLPFYGFHLLLCWLAGTMLRLNRIKVYLAANISNPFVAPWLLFVELQTGAWLRHGTFQPITLRAIRATGLGGVGIDLLLGSVVVGTVLAIVAGTVTYALLRGSADNGVLTELVRRASDRYVGHSIIAWEFARGKLRGDPIYRAALFDRLLPSGGTLIDIGCGQGLMLALLAEARQAAVARPWPANLPAPPQYDRMIGVEIRPKVAAAARAALANDAEIIQADVRSQALGPARAVLLFDVLHMLDRGQQDALLSSLAGRLDSRGVVLVRDADAAAGWRFLTVRAGNRLKAIAFGSWRQRFCFRTRTEWLTCFASHGFQADVRSMGEGTPFANLVFVLTVAGSAAERPNAPPE